MSHLSSQSVLILDSYSALTETENQQVLRELHSTRHPRSFLNCHGNRYKFFFSEQTQHKARIFTSLSLLLFAYQHTY